MASLFGARLLRFGGAAVTLTGSWPEALSSIAIHGIRVEDPSGIWSARPEVVPLDSSQAPADVVLVLVKSHQTAHVAGAVARALSPTGHAVTLQNGLGNREVLLRAAGPGRVSVGVATVGATLLGAGQVRATAGSVILGTGQSPAPSLLVLARLLSASGFETTLEADVDRAVWRKLAVNCAINPLSALAGCPNGGLLEAPELRATLVAAAREVGAVAAAKGIDLGADPAELALAVAQKTAANRSSMLQDVCRGAPTEIEALNGAVVREARAAGVLVPVNESLWRRIVEVEARAERSATA
jgi:2-dehydropantoate 2-reductase